MNRPVQEIREHLSFQLDVVRMMQGCQELPVEDAPDAASELVDIAEQLQ